MLVPAEWHRDQDSATGAQYSAHLFQRDEISTFLPGCPSPITRVVETDVLERRYTQDQVKGGIAIRHRTCVPLHQREAFESARVQIKRMQLGDAQPLKVVDVQRVAEGRADVQDPAVAAVARQDPWDLNNPLDHAACGI